MDLIYMNAEREDQGVLKDYTFDLAFGSDENDFEFEISKENHCCKEGYYLYFEGTEYGGIIDKIGVNTEDGSIIYKGRTWHGILEKKVLEPDAGEDYLILSGEANSLLAEIIERIGLDDLFSVPQVDSGIEIVEYQVNRYADAYSTIRKMLFEFTGKLHIEYKTDTVELSCVPYIDYSHDEEWDSTQLEFGIEKNFRPVNHLVCLGQGNLKDRAVIHLFTDENGGIQPYALKDVPLQDSDYILDKSQQVLFGTDEVCEVYELSNAGIVENYKVLSEQPSNWASNYSKYFKQKNDDNYEGLVATESETYALQSSQPADWSKNYGSYFAKSESKYVNVEGVSNTSYSKQTKKPADWSKNYGSYFYYWSDGTQFEYKSVNGVTKYKYVVQTMKPSDWKDNFGDYYIKNPKGKGYVQNKSTKWKPKKYYTKQSYSVAPKWINNYFYTKKTTTSAPTWKGSTYYTKTVDTIIPAWCPNAYFEKVFDHYAELVSGGVEKLKESLNCDKLEINLDPEQEYDIGDVVGASEQITGLATWQQITKKIVTIKDNDTNIQYKVGE